MPDQSSYAPGSFCWADLATSDAQSAKRFYTNLLGWEANEIPTGENAPPYIVLKKNGRDVAALYKASDDKPPMWMTHVAVSSADETAARARELGGIVTAGPLDAGHFGRFAIIRDPQGAPFAVWQAGTQIGAALYDEPGSLCWSELHTTDTDAPKKFYTTLFGWKMKESDDYVEWFTDAGAVGGMMKDDDVPPNWLVYFAVEDCDGTAARAQELGGEVYFGPDDIPNVGRFAVIADPQGAAFAVIALE